MQNATIGEVLSEARRRRGKSLKEVELDTKIRTKYVEALERDDFDYLPGDIYAKGFIKTYATYLGMDPEPLLQQYKGLYAQNDNFDLSNMPSDNLRLAKKQRPRWFIPAVVLGSVVGVFVILIAWGAIVSNMSSDQRIVVQDIKTRTTDTTVAAKTVKTDRYDAGSESDASASTTERSTTTTTEREDSKKGDGKIDVTVKLTGINDEGSWVRVTVDGEKEFEGIIEDGTSKLFQGDEKVQVRAGNVTGLEVMLNGKKQPQLETTRGIADKTFTKKDVDGKG